MLKLRRILCLFLAFLLTVQPAMAWSECGHHIIAVLAFDLMKPGEQMQVIELLQRHLRFVDEAPDAPAILLNREFGNSFEKLYMYKITWVGKMASISGKQAIPLNENYRSSYTSAEAATAPQPAPKMTIRAPRRTIRVSNRGITNISTTVCLEKNIQNRQIAVNRRLAPCSDAPRDRTPRHHDCEPARIIVPGRTEPGVDKYLSARQTVKV